VKASEIQISLSAWIEGKSVTINALLVTWLQFVANSEVALATIFVQSKSFLTVSFLHATLPKEQQPKHLSALHAK
jgi:hypothetical protein